MTKREMNKIEEDFFKAFCKYFRFDPNKDKQIDDCWITKCIPNMPSGIYFLDFYVETKDGCKYDIEIDGQDSHKTREQRFRDYSRERELQKKGIVVVRFMGSEVFVDVERCLEDFYEIYSEFTDIKVSLIDSVMEPMASRQ